MFAGRAVGVGVAIRMTIHLAIGDTLLTLGFSLVCHGCRTVKQQGIMTWRAGGQTDVSIVQMDGWRGGVTLRWRCRGMRSIMAAVMAVVAASGDLHQLPKNK